MYQVLVSKRFKHDLKGKPKKTTTSLILKDVIYYYDIITALKKGKPSMKTLYFTLQGKGGVGKTLGSSYLQQYLLSISNKKSKIMGIDTDPNNTSFTSIKKLNVKFLPLFDETQKINERNFDKMIELFYNNTDTTFIVDNGATSFLPLISYLVDNNIMEMLEDKFKIIIHIPITGGQAQDDTLNGMSYIANNAPFGHACRFKSDSQKEDIFIRAILA
jgi:hypothetical protein